MSIKSIILIHLTKAIGMKIVSVALLALTLGSVTVGQTTVDQKDLKKRTRPLPTLKRTYTAQQLEQRILKAEDERASIEPMLELFDIVHPGVASRLALAAGRIGDKTATNRLLDLLQSDKEQLRSVAAFALGEMEDPQVVPELLLKLQERKESYEIRAKVAEALGKIVANAENLKRIDKEQQTRILNNLTMRLPIPAKTLRDGEKPLVVQVLTALMRLNNPDALDLVAAQLGSPDPDIRFTAANTIARLLSQHKDAVLSQALREQVYLALKDNDPLVRAGAARVAGFIKTPESLDKLVELLSDPDQNVRANVIRAFANLADRRAAEPLILHANTLLERFHTSKERGIPSEMNHLLLVATSLGQLAPKEAKVIGLLKKLRTLPAGRIGANVETELALAKAGEDAFYDFTPEQGLKPGDWSAAESFATGLGELGGKRALEVLEQMLAGKYAGTLDARAIPAVLRSLVKLKHPRSKQWLREYLVNTHDAIVRATAAELILEGEWAQEDIDALLAGYEKAASDDMNDGKLAILTALAKTQRTVALQHLQKALREDDYLVRRQAAELLRLSKQPVLPLGTVKTGHDKDYYDAVLKFARRPQPIIAQLETTKGVIRIELFAQDAPMTVWNFVTLAKKGFFDGKSFHRVVPNFVIQGGDPRGDGNGGPGYQIRCEINQRPYVRGSVGMALSGKDTGGSQFFICHSPQPHLDGGYTVFGQVVSGMDVVDRIVRGDSIERITIE